MTLNFRILLTVCFAGVFLGFPSSTQATPEKGAQMPAFKLQALDSKFYGTEGAEGTISILYFLGYNCAPCVSFGAAVELVDK